MEKRQHTVKKQIIKRSISKLGAKVGVIEHDKVYTAYRDFFNQLKTFSKKELARKIIIVANKIVANEKEMIMDLQYQVLRQLPKRTLIRTLINLTIEYQKVPMFQKKPLETNGKEIEKAS